MVSSPTVRPIPMVTRAHFTGKLGAGAAMLRKRDELTGRFLAFQTKYRELRAQFLELRQSYFLIECAWCKARIRWKHKQGSVRDVCIFSRSGRCPAKLTYVDDPGR